MMSVESTIAAFAHSCDFEDLHDYGSYLHPNAFMTIQNRAGSDPVESSTIGRQNIIESARTLRLNHTLGPSSYKIHNLSTPSVNMEGASSATAITHWILIGVDQRQLRVLSAGFYRDRFVAGSDVWLLLERLTVVAVEQPN